MLHDAASPWDATNSDPAPAQADAGFFIESISGVIRDAFYSDRRMSTRRPCARARIAVLGYGSQGRAHALNLKDSGFDVVVGVRKGDSWKQAKRDGLDVDDARRSGGQAPTLVAMLVPDTTQKALYARAQGQARQGRHAAVRARLQHPLQADQAAQGPRRGADRAQGPGWPGAPPVPAGSRRAGADRGGAGRHRARPSARALAYAHGIGSTRGGVLQTTFAEETETDLFGEQAVLCGGATELVVKGFETLVEAGYQPEVAYYEVPARTEADRRPAARRRPREDAQVHQRPPPSGAT